MRVTMEQHIAVVRRTIRRNVLQPDAHMVSHDIDDYRPARIVIAISPNECERRPDDAQLIEQTLGADVTEMPDLIRVARQIENYRR